MYAIKLPSLLRCARHNSTRQRSHSARSPWQIVTIAQFLHDVEKQKCITFTCAFYFEWIEYKSGNLHGVPSRLSSSWCRHELVAVRLTKMQSGGNLHASHSICPSLHAEKASTDVACGKLPCFCYRISFSCGFQNIISVRVFYMPSLRRRNTLRIPSGAAPDNVSTRKTTHRSICLAKQYKKTSHHPARPFGLERLPKEAGI